MIRRGLLWGLAAALAAAGLAHAYAWAAAPGRLPARAVHVHGALERLDAAALEAAVAAELSGSMLTQDLAALRRRLEAEPWVRTARARRSWPDALAVEVVEQRPAAHWAAGGLLNGRGERFFPAGAERLELPRLAGAPGREAALMRTLERVRALLGPDGPAVRRLAESPRRSLTLELASGARLALGRERPLARLARWLRYRAALARRAPAAAAVDLRYPNGFAVRRADPS